MCLDKEGRIDWEFEDHARGRSRGGFATRLHAVTDACALGHGRPGTGPGIPKYVEQALNAVRVPQRRGRPRQRPRRVIGDRATASAGSACGCPVTGCRRSSPTGPTNVRDRGTRLSGFNRTRYRRRHIIENGIGWLKECRRMTTRYEEFALTFVSMLKLPMIRCYFDHLHSADTLQTRPSRSVNFYAASHDPAGSKEMVLWAACPYVDTVNTDGQPGRSRRDPEVVCTLQCPPRR